MAVTAEGVFKIVNRASDPIKKIRTDASEATKATDSMGKSLDNLNSSKVTQSINRTKENVSDLGKTTENMSRKVEDSTNRSGRAYERMARKGEDSIDRLTLALKRFEHEKATATVDVNIAKAEAKIRLIKEQLRSVSTEHARRELASMGLVADQAAASLAGGGAGGGGPGKSLAGAAFEATSGIGLMGVAVLAAAPAVVALTGAVSALVGSLAMAVGGAGALGVGVLGSFIVGIGSLAMVIVPAVSALKEVKKEQDAYNKAVQSYGANSAQAVKAHKLLLAQYKKNPGAGSVLNNVKTVTGRLKRATAPGREDFFGMLNDGLETANSLLPTFASIANKAMHSVRGALDEVFRRLRGAEWRSIFTTLGDTFDKIVGPLTRGLEEIARFFGRVAVAASPLVVQMFNSFDRWSTNLAKSARDQNHVRSVIIDMVSQLKSWIHFFGAAVKLTAAFFGSGAKQGQDMLKGITAQLNKWTDWIHTHPQEMHDFFTRTIDSAGKLVHALGAIAKTLAQISDSLLPMLNAISDVVSMLGGAGLMGPLATGAAAAIWMNRFNKLRAGFGGTASAAATGAVAGMAGGVAGGMAAGAAAPALERTVMDSAGNVVAGPGRAIALPAAGGSTMARAGFMQRMGWRGQAMVSRAGAGVTAIGSRVGPILGIMAGLGALQGMQGQPGADRSFGGRFRDMSAGAFGAFGLHPFQTSAEQNQARISSDMKALQGWERNNLVPGNSLQAVTRQIRQLRGQRGVVAADRSSTASERTATIAAMNQEIQARKNLIPYLRQERDARKTQRGADYTQSTAQAYQIDIKHLGPEKAYKNLIDNIEKGFRGRTGPGAKLIAQDGLQMARIAAQKNPALRKQYEHLAKDVQQRFSDMGAHVDKVNGNIYTGSDKEWKKIREAITRPAEQARQRAHDSFTKLQEDAIGSMMGMGLSRAEATKIIRSTDASTTAPNVTTSTQQQSNRIHQGVHANANTFGGLTTPTGGPAIGGLPMGARGMRIPGVGNADQVPLMLGMAAPGEMIVNRHTEQRINRMLGAYGTSLGHEVAHEARPHGMPQFAFGSPDAHDAGRRARAHQGSGSATAPALAGGIWSGVHEGVKNAAAAIMQQFPGLTVPGIGNTTGGGHVPNSYHYRGEAVDIDGPQAIMDAAARWIDKNMRSSLAEGIHNPGLSVKNGAEAPSSIWGSLWAGHRDHIHIAVAGALGAIGDAPAGGGGGGYGSIHLPRRRSGLKGIPGALSDRAMAVLGAAIEHKVNGKLATMGGPGGGPNMSGITGNNQQMAHDAMLTMWAENQWPPLKTLWTQESNFSETARNKSSGAYGIPQALPASKMGPAAQGSGSAAARAQIAWGLNYIKGRYGSPSNAWAHEMSHNWYALGGRAGGAAVVGDSLEVGTGPYLRGLMGGAKIDARTGRPSAEGAHALQSMLKGGNFSKVLFDLGTNDGSASQLGKSLRTAMAAAGGLPMYVPTVRGPGAAQKNALLRGTQGIHLIDWAAHSSGLVGGDGIHATGKGYKQRAAMIAAAMGGGGGSNAPTQFGGWFGGGGAFTAHGPTVIGVGERPGQRETVHVKPIAMKAGGGARGSSIQIHIEHLHNHEQGDIQEIIEREFAAAAASLERGPMDSEDEMG